ncbi:OmpA family protein [Nitriliruptor alkaliphilus]|uniref:OmpA family protein n=1 Tax=Nitriliruptor alkaliphilus TaxID=427918 RepID=UPI00069791B9|nr:OmpA family protein [Nitriliruptor alkaliphilus]
MRNSRAVARQRTTGDRATALTVVLGLVLAACFGGDGDGDGDGDGEAAEPGVTIADGPAPSSWGSDDLVRLDQVARDGDSVTLDLTLAARTERTFRDHDVRLITNTGIELPRPAEQDRTLPSRSTASLQLVATGIEDGTRTLQLDVLGRGLQVELPEDGEKLRFPEAPLRQAGFVDAVMRDRSPVVVQPYTVRSEGFITEVTFLALALTHTNPDLCRYGDCELVDSSGRTYPRIGGWYEFPDAYGSQVRGTLRFLGELDPDETEFQLRLGGSSGFLTTPDANLELGFSLARAEDTPLKVAAGDTFPEAFDVGQTIEEGAGTVIELGRMSFHEDRIQVEVSASRTTEDGRNLNFRGESALVDPSGYRHPMMQAADGGDLVVESGGTLDATLVFLSPLAPGVDELTLEFARRETPTRVTIELPARPAPEAGDEVSLPDESVEGDDEPSAAALPAHILAASSEDDAEDAEDADDAGEAEDEPMVTVAIDIDGELEPTTWNPRGRVATTVAGRGGGDPDTVDADDAAEAEASLEDLGAERTPDGLVVTLPETVLFEFDSADLVGDADEVVVRVAEILAFYTDVQVEVRGHTDDVGSDEYNQELSEGRAQAVVDALVAAGASSSQLTAVGFGATDPVAPNATADGEDDPEGRQRNRRVEIVLRE